MRYSIVYLIIMMFFLMSALKKRRARDDGESRDRQSSSRQGRSRRTPARSTDGHILRGKDDITCRQYGHRHDNDTAPRFIVHDDPEDGYILLNGIKMRISEADKYENQI